MLTNKKPYNIFTPSGEQAQYAICSPIVDENGTIYFKNDSAFLMAVGSTVDRVEITKNPDKLEYLAGDVFDATGMEVTAHYKNGTSLDVTDYVKWSTEKLTADDTDFQITLPFAMYQNREKDGGMEFGIKCLEPFTTLNIKVEGANVNYGDINGDGVISSTDAAMIYRYSNGKFTFTDEQKAAADVNGDGVISSTDAALVYRKSNGKLAKFPVENK
ncbi:MAG: dockerin type I repeat-containing protein [Eubacteriales bacterium]|nr:dockerin type I repeat-containing protein [Eubacteriales bacterium]